MAYLEDLFSPRSGKKSQIATQTERVAAKKKFLSQDLLVLAEDRFVLKKTSDAQLKSADSPAALRVASGVADRIEEAIGIKLPQPDYTPESVIEAFVISGDLSIAPCRFAKISYVDTPASESKELATAIMFHGRDDVLAIDMDEESARTGRFKLRARRTVIAEDDKAASVAEDVLSVERSLHPLGEQIRLTVRVTRRDVAGSQARKRAPVVGEDTLVIYYAAPLAGAYTLFPEALVSARTRAGMDRLFSVFAPKLTPSVLDSLFNISEAQLIRRFGSNLRVEALSTLIERGGSRDRESVWVARQGDLAVDAFSVAKSADELVSGFSPAPQISAFLQKKGWEAYALKVDEYAETAEARWSDAALSGFPREVRDAADAVMLAEAAPPRLRARAGPRAPREYNPAEDPPLPPQAVISESRIAELQAAIGGEYRDLVQAAQKGEAADASAAETTALAECVDLFDAGLSVIGEAEIGLVWERLGRGLFGETTGPEGFRMSSRREDNAPRWTIVNHSGGWWEGNGLTLVYLAEASPSPDDIIGSLQKIGFYVGPLPADAGMAVVALNTGDDNSRTRALTIARVEDPEVWPSALAAVLLGPAAFRDLAEAARRGGFEVSATAPPTVRETGEPLANPPRHAAGIVDLARGRGQRGIETMLRLTEMAAAARRHDNREQSRARAAKPRSGIAARARAQENADSALPGVLSESVEFEFRVQRVTPQMFYRVLEHFSDRPSFEPNRADTVTVIGDWRLKESGDAADTEATVAGLGSDGGAQVESKSTLYRSGKGAPSETHLGVGTAVSVERVHDPAQVADRIAEEFAAGAALVRHRRRSSVSVNGIARADFTMTRSHFTDSDKPDTVRFEVEVEVQNEGELAFAVAALVDILHVARATPFMYALSKAPRSDSDLSPVLDAYRNRLMARPRNIKTSDFAPARLGAGYFAAAKADGEPAVMVVAETGVWLLPAAGGMSLIVPSGARPATEREFSPDKVDFLDQPSAEYTDALSDLFGCVIFGERIPTKNSKAGKSALATLFAPFDALAGPGGESLKGRPFSARFAAAADLCSRVADALEEFPAYVAFMYKNIYSAGETAESASAALRAANSEAVEFETDGVIFTPENARPDGKPFAGEAPLDVLKAKPWRELTIDFAVDADARRVYVVGNDSKLVPFSAHGFDPETQIAWDAPTIAAVPPGTLVEFGPEDEFPGASDAPVLGPRRIRADKENPNGEYTAGDVYRDILRPIPKALVMGESDLSVLFSMINHSKQDVITSAVGRGKEPVVVVDLGAGRGGDLGKYKRVLDRRLARVIAVEPDPGNIGSLRERAEASGFGDRIFTLENRAEDTAPIATALRAALAEFPDARVLVSMMLSMSFFWESPERVAELKRTLSALAQAADDLGSGAVLAFATIEGTRTRKLVFEENPGMFSGPGLTVEARSLEAPEKGLYVSLPGTIVGDRQLEYLVDLSDIPGASQGQQLVDSEKLGYLSGVAQKYGSLFVGGAAELEPAKSDGPAPRGLSEVLATVGVAERKAAAAAEVTRRARGWATLSLAGPEGLPPVVYLEESERDFLFGASGVAAAAAPGARAEVVRGTPGSPVRRRRARVEAWTAKAVADNAFAEKPWEMSRFQNAVTIASVIAAPAPGGRAFGLSARGVLVDTAAGYGDGLAAAVLARCSGYQGAAADPDAALAVLGGLAAPTAFRAEVAQDALPESARGSVVLAWAGDSAEAAVEAVRAHAVPDHEGAARAVIAIPASSDTDIPGTLNAALTGLTRDGFEFEFIAESLYTENATGARLAGLPAEAYPLAPGANTVFAVFHRAHAPARLLSP